MVWFIPALSSLFGALIGALIVMFSVLIKENIYQKNQQKKEKIKQAQTEMQVVLLLNNKINEILRKRHILMPEYVSFDAFDDCFISIEDYVYLQSIAAQNHFYLPNYVIEEFFKDIAIRQVVLSPEETTEIGGYAYKGGRLYLEKFSDQLLSIADDRKHEIMQLKRG